MKNNIFKYFAVWYALSNYDIGVARGTVFREIRPAECLKNGFFDEEMLEGLP